MGTRFGVLSEGPLFLLQFPGDAGQPTSTPKSQEGKLLLI